MTELEIVLIKLPIFTPFCFRLLDCPLDKLTSASTNPLPSNVSDRVHEPNLKSKNP